MSAGGSPFECVLDIKAGLGEGPVWSAAEQVLYWVDIRAPSLNRFDPASGTNTAWPMPAAIGCLALREQGGFVVALRDGFWTVAADGRLGERKAAAPYDPAHHRFNDGRVDPQGRFWAGSMNEQRDAPSAALYRLDPDWSVHRVIGGVTISNGLAWSPDGATLYHADTPPRTIRSYPFDGARGTVGEPRVFARFEGETDRPDGGAVDSEGCYWSAFFRGGKVVRLAQDGRMLAQYAVPAMCPTMCAFGGSDLRTLFVTSSARDRPADELIRLPQSGGIFAMRVDVAGLPEPRFAA